MARIQEICKRVYRNLMLSGYARIDLRLDESRPGLRDRGQPQPADLAGRGLRALGRRRAGTDFGALLEKIVTLGLSWEPTRWG